jgi:DNA-3-methyladenine glycosylase I
MDGRCPWCGDDPLYVHYHDTDWGVPEYDGRALWEKLVLDGFQAGLSWITILKKREAFRAAFQGFRPEVIAGWGVAEVERLLADPGIVRHRGKIEGTITSAQAYLRIEADQGFSNYIWGYVGGKAYPEPAGKHGGCAGGDGDFDTDVKGSEEGGIHLLRADDCLCVHAGLWAGE